MQDMLVSLLALPRIEPYVARLKQQEIFLRRVQPWEKTKLLEFVAKNFSSGWADEVSVAFTHQPVTCFMAHTQGECVGFAAYECTRKNFLGPVGVAAAWEKRGIGAALTLAALYGLQELGYAYAIIGGVSSTLFYEKTVGAWAIPHKFPTIYSLQSEPRWGYQEE